MDRRTFLVGSALGGLAAQPAYAQYFDDAWLKTPPQRPLAPADIESAVENCANSFSPSLTLLMSRTLSFPISS